MSLFRTNLSPTPFPFLFHHTHQILSIGSCFAEHIGAKLNRYKFANLLNPVGILYNPVSIAKSIDRLFGDQLYKKDDLIKS